MLAPFVGKRTLQLVTAPVETDGRCENGANQPEGVKGFQKKPESTDVSDSSHGGLNRSKPGTELRIAAILRAPQQIQALYTQGQIGQVQAARLGPRPPKRGLDPDTAARIAETTQQVLAFEEKPVRNHKSPHWF